MRKGNVMSKRADIIVAAALATAACQGPGAGSDRVESQLGEKLYCGESFSILVPGTDSVMINPDTPADDRLYVWLRPRNEIIIYEGNDPPPVGLVIRTRTPGRPAAVAVDARPEEARTLRLFGAEGRPANCLAPRPMLAAS